MFFAAAAVLIIGFVVTMWLLAIASHAKPGTDQANARLDAVRTGLAAGAGAGAAVGLMLAFRRQHHQEIATVLTDRDATERRITELYTKAVEQLGNDKAPVRLGGLYALERLAQDNPAQRQTIVNVICAYLRMPFSSTASASKPAPEATEGPGELATETKARTDWNSDTWWQERQVRLTAQRILGEHLRDDRSKDKHSADSPNSRFWPNISLDLVGATLIDFSFENCEIANADFSWATFSGDNRFSGATFDGFAWFSRATFDCFVRFDGVTFSGSAVFAAAVFSTGADFRWTTFSGDASFGAATADAILFRGATFSREAVFQVARFRDDAGFDDAVFDGTADFCGATFSGNAGFLGTTFKGHAGFDDATFEGNAGFNDASFNGNARFDAASFNGGESSFSFERSRVLSSSGRHVWPTGWCLGPDGSGGYTVVRANDAGRS
jgi:uncharacterized protein YjbI with pentapeptide repeats